MGTYLAAGIMLPRRDKTLLPRCISALDEGLAKSRSQFEESVHTKITLSDPVPNVRSEALTLRVILLREALQMICSLSLRRG